VGQRSGEVICWPDVWSSGRGRTDWSGPYPEKLNVVDEQRGAAAVPEPVRAMIRTAVTVAGEHPGVDNAEVDGALAIMVESGSCRARWER
jgi:hypothetical protein